MSAALVNNDATSQLASPRHGSNSELRSSCEGAMQHNAVSFDDDTRANQLVSTKHNNNDDARNDLEFNHKKFRMHRKRKLYSPSEVTSHLDSQAEDSASPSSPESVVVDDVTSSEDELRAINSPSSCSGSPLAATHFEFDSPVDFNNSYNSVTDQVYHNTFPHQNPFDLS